MRRFVVVFIVLLVVLWGIRISGFGQEYIVVPFTEVLAWVSAVLMTSFDSDVVAHGIDIQSLSTGFAVRIAPGCDGIEAVIILLSAVIAFPSPWKHKLIGIGIGFVAIQALNLVRIISLFYMGQWSQTMFDWFHLYLWQALIVLDALAVFLIWLRYLPPPDRSGRSGPGPDGPNEASESATAAVA
jgi:exosortase H (IPTLxxWG-CTERM-specific)